MGSSQSHHAVASRRFAACEFAKTLIAKEEKAARAQLLQEFAAALLTSGGTVRVISKAQVSRNAFVVTFSFPCRLKLVPGGHVRISGNKSARSYTPFVVNSDSLAVVVKRYTPGVVSSFLCDCRVGDFLRIAGPVEPFFSVVGERFDVLWLIGGGTGIAPVYSMACHCAAEKTCSKIVLIGCFRDVDDTILVSNMAKLGSDYPQLLDVHVVLSKSQEKISGGSIHTFSGRFCLEHARSLPRPTQAVICGPPGFDTTMLALLAGVGLPEERVGVL
jgi:ferredoxin-NADP reductase